VLEVDSFKLGGSSPPNGTCDDPVLHLIPSDPAVSIESVPDHSCHTGRTCTVHSTHTCLIDYLRCSFPADEVTLEDLTSWLAPSKSWLNVNRSGTSKWISGALTLMCDNAGNFRLEATGAGCRELETNLGLQGEKDWRNFLSALKSHGATFRRLDWAFDSIDGPLDMDTIVEATRERHYVSQVRQNRVEELSKTGRSQKSFLVRFGSRGSDLALRIYDKSSSLGRTACPSSWVRVEIESLHTGAETLARAFVAHGFTVLKAELGAYLSFRVPPKNDTNKRRWKIAPWWTSFLDHVAAASIRVKSADNTLERAAAMFESQQAPTLAALYLALGPEWLNRVIIQGRKRWKPKHLALLKSPEPRPDATATVTSEGRLLGSGPLVAAA
jgi:hypothetical protein